MASLPNYNIAPTPQGGSGAYGSVPGVIGIPDNIYQQVNSAVAGAAKLAPDAAGVIGSEINGQVTPQTQDFLQNKAASMGVASGMPGSGFQTNNFLESLGLDSQALQSKGVSDYLSFLGGVGATQTDPNLAVGVATQNAVDAAAPNPTAAAMTNKNFFDQYLASLKTPSSGSGSSVSWTPAGAPSYFHLPVPSA
jgi:hypothetical protein